MTLRGAPRTSDDAPTDLVVFSHPNHELAVFGLLQQRRPALLYLTDGGGGDRVMQTREGLRSLGLLGQATFLDNTEHSFYEALLNRDVPFFERVAGCVAEAIGRWRPERVLCDAVEFYNPVHDISLPLVARALLSTTATLNHAVETFEIPLIQQVASASGEAYLVQRPVASRAASVRTLQLTAGEVAAKRRARDDVYTLLAAQLGPVIADLSEQTLATETLLPAQSPLIKPADSLLRYEWRAELLHRKGLIERPITYAGHFLPVAASLAGDWLPGSPVTAGGRPG